MESTKDTRDTEEVYADNLDQAEEVLKDTPFETKKGRLTDKQLCKLTDVILSFSQMMCGIDLHDYELEFGWRVIYSILVEDAEEITALFARQSGKTETVAVTVCGLMVMLPLLAEKIPHDDRIVKFKDGFWVGIYAPHYHQSDIMFRRMKARMYSQESKATLLDPEIDIDLTKKKVIENLKLPNKSSVHCGTAAPQSKIEGETFHLIICEEAQDIDRNALRSSIHPMAAATAGSLVKIGTVNRVKSDFFEACKRNKRSDIVHGRTRAAKRKHFEFDYTVAQRNNPKYRKYVEKEIERLGYDSDDFRMKYRLHWLLERGMFVNSDMFDECGIKEADYLKVYKGGRGRRRAIKFMRSHNLITYDPSTQKIVASVDVGKEFSTVVTIGRPFYDMPIDYADTIRFPIHIWNWLELQGDDHEEQHSKILDFLANYRISDVIVDATGKGDPVYSRLAADLRSLDIAVHPFIFSATSKDRGYKAFLQEINSKRFTYPAGPMAARTQKWKRFQLQMTDLRKTWRGNTMVVQKDKTSDEARDDYCMAEDMEILTQSGWEGFKTFSTTSLVANYDPSTEAIQYLPATRIIRRNLYRKEFMVSIQGDFVDQLVTDCHKMYFEKMTKGNIWIRDIDTAESLLQISPNKVSIPAAAKQTPRWATYQRHEILSMGHRLLTGELPSIPKSMLGALTSDECYFLLSLFLTNGECGEITDIDRGYFVKSKALADGVHELAFKSGKYSRIEMTDTGYLVYLYDLKRSPIVTCEKKEYSGSVWCVTVPTGFFICRRNGKISVTGNCDSAMMLNWLVNVGASMEVEEGDNMLLGRVARLASNGDIHGAVRAMNQRLKTYRKNLGFSKKRRQNSKWD